MSKKNTRPNNIDRFLFTVRESGTRTAIELTRVMEEQGRVCTISVEPFARVLLNVVEVGPRPESGNIAKSINAGTLTQARQVEWDGVYETEPLITRIDWQQMCRDLGI